MPDVHRPYQRSTPRAAGGGVGRLRRAEEDVLVDVAALERVRLVDLCQVVAELDGVAEALADHPARVAEVGEAGDRDVRQAAVALQLRNAGDPVLGRNVPGIGAERR